MPHMELRKVNLLYRIASFPPVNGGTSCNPTPQRPLKRGLFTEVARCSLKLKRDFLHDFRKSLPSRQLEAPRIA